MNDRQLQESLPPTPVVEEVDCCVIGGSCTGVFAAVRAARRGLRVAVVEALGAFGGTATASLVNVWHSLYDISGERQIIAGLTAEVLDRLARRDAVIANEPSPSLPYRFNSQELRLELDELVGEHDIRPFLHARFAAPVVDEAGRLIAVAIEDASGRRAIRARCFIDASGNAELAQRAGCPCRIPTVVQPPTTCAVVAGLEAVYAADPDFNFGRAAFDPQYPEALPPGFLWTAGLPGADGLTMVAGTRVHGANVGDADQLTRAEMSGRAQVRRLLDLLRRRIPGGEAVRLVDLADRIGCRDSRHPHCRYTISEEEVLRGKAFDDAIGFGSYRVDLHTPDGHGITLRYLDGREEFLAHGRKESSRWAAPGEATATYYQIPWRCLLPRQATNLVIAGRCIDAEPGAFGALRVMVNCNQMGEAAGEAAALSCESGLDFPALEVGDLRQRLADGGSITDP